MLPRVLIERRQAAADRDEPRDGDAHHQRLLRRRGRLLAHSDPVGLDQLQVASVASARARQTFAMGSETSQSAALACRIRPRQALRVLVERGAEAEVELPGTTDTTQGI